MERGAKDWKGQAMMVVVVVVVVVVGLVGAIVMCCRSVQSMHDPDFKT